MQIAHDQITLDQYAETLDRLKEEIPEDRVIEVEGHRVVAERTDQGGAGGDA